MAFPRSEHEPSAHPASMPATMTMTTAFVAPLPLASRAASPLRVSPISFRPRAPATRAARMSLLSELIFKAAEVGAATYATTLFSSQKDRNSAGESVNGVAAAVPNFADLPLQVRDLLSAAEDISSRLPELVESGTPEQRKWIKLGLCLVIDLFGSGSLPVPLLADALDIVWAPIAALALHALFANPLVTAGGFAEEILPGTDGVPTACLAWIYENYGKDIQKMWDDVGVTEVKAVAVEGEGKRKGARKAAKAAPFGGAFQRPERRSREKSKSKMR